MKLPTRLALGLLALLSSCPAAGQERVVARPSSVLVAHVDPAILAPRLVLPAPIILGATLGIPRVIAWAGTSPAAGIAWGSTASITAGNAYVSYNGTNMLLNVPTGDGFSFLVNNVEVFGVPTGGGIKTNVIQIASGTTLTIKDAAGNNGVVYTDEGTTMSVVFSDNITAEGGTFNENVALLSSLALSGTITDPAFPDLLFESDSDGWKFGGNVVIYGVADFLQFRITANATQTANLFVIEDFAGTDYLRVIGSGAVQIFGNFDANLSGGSTGLGKTTITGTSDVVQLTVHGNATQTTLPFVVENSGGTDVATISNTGALVVSSCTGCGAGIGGSTGATDNAILRADGTGGATLQTSVLTIADTTGTILNTYTAGTFAISSSTASTGGTDTGISVGTVNDFGAGDYVFTVMDNNGAVRALSMDGAGTLTLTGANNSIVFSTASSTEFNCNSTCNFADDITSTGVVTGSNFVAGSNSEVDASIGGSTTIGKAPMAMTPSFTAVGNVGGGPDDLITLTLPANALSGNLFYFEFHAWGTIANTAAAKTLTCFLGSAAISTHAMSTSIAGNWDLVVTIGRTGVDTQDYTSKYEGNTAAANTFDYDQEMGAAAEDDGATIAVKCQATTVTNTNDIVQEGATLAFYRN